MLEQYLDELEKMIDPETEEDVLEQWKRFWGGRTGSGAFRPRRKKAAAAPRWPKVRVNEALRNFDLMALQQISGCATSIADGGGGIMNVRANYGTGILPSLFGAEVYEMEEQMDTLPTTWPMARTADSIERLVEKGVPDLRNGFGEKCFHMARYFRKLFAPYPGISKYVHIYHPDTQGPMDVCELLVGSDLFIHVVDNPDLMHSLLKLVTETHVLFMREWERIVPPGGGFSAHWGLLQKGRIMLRDDSAMNLSPEMFDEFIVPYDQRLLSEFGGGCVHFCGRGDHYIDRLPLMEGVFAIAMSQPEYNNMERIYSNTVDKGIAMLALASSEAERALASGRNLRGRVHCR